MKFYLSVFCLINVITVVKSAQIDIRPSTNLQAGEPTLTVRCQPTTTSGVTSVYLLEIVRLREGVSTEQSLGSIQVTEQPRLGPGLTSPKYTVTGSLTSISAVSTSFVQIVIQDPDCNDKGEYICKVSGANNGGPLNPEKRTNVTVQDNPSSLLINVVPRMSQYTLNDSILISCNGNVGNPPRTWQWQTRRFPASTQWIRYTDESDIVTDPVTPPSGTSCSYRQQTVLTYRVKAQDDGLEFRCILDNREDFSQNFTIHTGYEPVMTTPIPSIESTTPLKTEGPVTSTLSRPVESSTQSSGGSEERENMTTVTVLAVFLAISVVYGVVISIIAGYLCGKHRGDSRQNQQSAYESVQHIPTTNSVYTSLENNGQPKPVNGPK